jgi:hypothetical protein
MEGLPNRLEHFELVQGVTELKGRFCGSFEQRDKSPL